MKKKPLTWIYKNGTIVNTSVGFFRNKFIQEKRKNTFDEARRRPSDKKEQVFV